MGIDLPVRHPLSTLNLAGCGVLHSRKSLQIRSIRVILYHSPGRKGDKIHVHYGLPSKGLDNR